MPEAQPAAPSGPAVDRAGNTADDPTKNVLDLVEAETKRQDDLREAENRHLREVLMLREEVRQAGEGNLADVARLRDRHAKELREMEANRINAIRAVDVEAVQRAAEVQATQAGILAGQVQASAEAMRTQVTAATTAATMGLTNALEPITKDIADLRKAQYEAQGQKTQVVETRTGQQNIGLWVGLGFTALSLVIAAVGIVVILIVNSGAS